MTEGRWRMANDECQMADDECQVAEGEIQVAGGELKMGDERREVEAGGCDEGQSSEPMTREAPVPVVGHDSQRVTLMRRLTRMESCPTKVRTRQANRHRAMASGSASLRT